MRRTALLAIAGSLLLGSCKREPPAAPVATPAPSEPGGDSGAGAAEEEARSPWLADVVARLQRDAASRDAMLDELEQRDLSAAEGLQLLSITTLTFAGPDDGETAAALLALLAGNARVEYVPVVKQLFPRLAAPTRESALELLAATDDAEAARTYMKLLADSAGALEALPVRVLKKYPHHAEIFFPGLLDFAAKPQFADEVYLTALAFGDKGLLRPESFKGHTAPLLADWRAERDWLEAHQGKKGLGWIWAEEYQGHRERGGLLLDLFGFLPPGDVEAELSGALKFRDPKLVWFAVSSLLEQGREAPAAALELAAASPELRAWVYEKLEARQQLALYPKKFLTQEALAEAVMVQWLVYPTELGRPPDEIVLGKVVSSESPDGALDTYVFKFRMFPPHWAAKNGWMAGVAGPFLRKNAPSLVDSGGTFSGFESWSSKTPEDHAGKIEKLLDKAYQLNPPKKEPPKRKQP